MNQKKRTLIFAGAIVIGSINKFLLSFDNSNLFSQFMNCYFNDVVGCCGYCAYCDISTVFFINKELKPLYIVVIAICSGVFWEYITPLFRHDTVSDPIDIVAYSFGALMYVILRFVVTKKSKIVEDSSEERIAN